MVSIVYDCDPGVDDGLAIILALNSKKIELKGITTVYGTSLIAQTTLNACRILDYLEKDIPVSRGADRPLKASLYKSEGKVESSDTGIHGRDGFGDSPLLVNNTDRKLEKEKAEDFIIKKIKEGIRTLVATGPLTNIALAFHKNPNIMNKLDKLIVMGGVINSTGNIDRLSEFNFFADPHAADYVLNTAKTRIILLPLNVTHKVIFTRKQRERLKETRTGKIAKSMLEVYQNNYISSGFKGNPLHDPSAMMYLEEPSLFKLVPMNLRVETKGKYTRGVCVPENRPWIKTNPNVFVAMKVKKGGFLKEFKHLIEHEKTKNKADIF